MKYIMIGILAIGLSACGNTISGIGQDISYVGSKVTTWQTSSSKEDDKTETKTK